jgi:hypothetical protein
MLSIRATALEFSQAEIKIKMRAGTERSWQAAEFNRAGTWTQVISADAIFFAVLSPPPQAFTFPVPH